jgi:hypothetical protein
MMIHTTQDPLGPIEEPIPHPQPEPIPDPEPPAPGMPRPPGMLGA